MPQLVPVLLSPSGHACFGTALQYVRKECGQTLSRRRLPPPHTLGRSYPGPFPAYRHLLKQPDLILAGISAAILAGLVRHGVDKGRSSQVHCEIL